MRGSPSRPGLLRRLTTARLRPLDRPGAAGARVRALLRREAGHPHWAHEYAARLARRHAPGHDILIQSSMSPTGPFHIGNFRDTVTAYLVQRALAAQGRRATLLLSFDDFDPVRTGAGLREASLAAYEGRPLADHPAAGGYCERYVEECRRAGVLGPAGPFVVHHQAERYRAGTYARLQRQLLRDGSRLARLLGTTPDRLFRSYCAQCGRNTTVLLGRGRTGVRYGCRHCGAVVRARDVRGVKPAWKLDWALRVVHEGIDCEPAGADHCGAGSTMERTQILLPAYFARPQPVIVPYALVRQGADRRRVSASGGGGLTPTDLLEVMPAVMVRWWYARADCWRDLRIGLSFAWLTRAYHEFDAFCGAVARGDARARVLWALVSDEPPPAVGLPGFRRTLHVLQSMLYCRSAAAGRLAVPTPGPAPALARTALEERLGHARAWLAGRGRSRCWLPAEPACDAEDVPPVTERMRRSERLGDAFAPEEYQTFYLVLYGCRRGPPLRRVVELEGAAAVIDAVRAFEQHGERPLRRLALARLAGDR